MVAARVAFMPTTQSASERARAADSSSFISSPSRRCWNAAWIALRVIDDSHRRLTGFFDFEVSYV